jgi:hypothetical protein
VVLVLNEIVGFADVPQHTPRAVTTTPPSLVILPPLVAVVLVIEDAAVVVSVGIEVVVKLISYP